TYEESMKGYGAFGEIVQLDYVDADGFAKLVAALSTGDWVKVAEAIPAVNQDVVAPLVNAGTALQDFLEGRSDDEAVAAGQGVSARGRRARGERLPPGWGSSRFREPSSPSRPPVLRGQPPPATRGRSARRFSA